ncbi:hypothetical protein BKA70DRAFT_1215104 [Coprinopsis sp. MPI-PUGE-AT-0042]|nr:hypothetical protein BKA70DRAFT_1215104 [Coprinopsis sp. MPI-PUGE-AT-0042]
MADVQSQNFPQSPSTEGGEPRLGNDPRSKEDQEADAKLAERLSVMIESANERVVPLVKMVRQKIEAFENKSPDDRSEEQLVKEVRPLLEQAEKSLTRTNGAIRGADPDHRLTSKAKRSFAEHTQLLKSSVSHRRLKWRRKIWVPLLDALGQPLTQIVGGVGLLLAGVLNLVGNLLSGLGLDGLLKGIFAATGLSQIYKGLGLDKWLNYGTGKN